MFSDITELVTSIPELPTLIGVLGIAGLVLALLGVVLALAHATRRAGILLMILTFVISLPMIFALREALSLINTVVLSRFDFPFQLEVTNAIGFALPLIIGVIFIFLMSARKVKLLAPALVVVAIGAPLLMYNFFSVADEVAYAQSVAAAEKARLAAIQKKDELEAEAPEKISQFESSEDLLDRGGATEEEFEERRRILEEGRQAANKQDWRQIHQKKQRADGNETENAAEIKATVADIEQEKAEEEAIIPLTPEQAKKADIWNYYLLYLSQFSLCLLLIVAVLEYIRRLCEPQSELFALPIFGKWMELFFTRPRFIRVQSEDLGLLRQLMKRMVGRGDSFIYLGESNLWPDGRLRTWPIFGRKSVHCWTPHDEDYDVELILESAWFQRMNVVMLGGDLAEQEFLRAMEALMKYRENSKAKNFGRTNLVIHASAMQNDQLLREMMLICRRTDMRLWLMGQKQFSDAIESAFDVVITEAVARKMKRGGVPQPKFDLGYAHKTPGQATLRKPNHALPPASLLYNQHHFAEASGKAEADL